MDLGDIYHQEMHDEQQELINHIEFVEMPPKERIACSCYGMGETCIC